MFTPIPFCNSLSTQLECHMAHLYLFLIFKTTFSLLLAYRPASVGSSVGAIVVAAAVEPTVGAGVLGIVGTAVGAAVGAAVGEIVGVAVGDKVGVMVGREDGLLDGAADTDGALDGAADGVEVGQTPQAFLHFFATVLSSHMDESIVPQTTVSLFFFLPILTFLNGSHETGHTSFTFFFLFLWSFALHKSALSMSSQSIDNTSPSSFTSKVFVLLMQDLLTFLPPFFPFFLLELWPLLPLFWRF